MPDPDPRLLDPAHDPPREPFLSCPCAGCRGAERWIACADAARAALQEAVEVLADLGLGVDTFLIARRERR